MADDGSLGETVGSVLLLPITRVDVFKTIRLEPRSNRISGRALKNVYVFKIQYLINEKYKNDLGIKIKGTEWISAN